MKGKTVVTEVLIVAYRETHFIVSEPERLVLQVGTHNAGLAQLHAQFGASSSAFVTACNPFSQEVGAVNNAQRTMSLEADLRETRFTYFEGVGENPNGNWPGEASFLVLGIPLDEARALGSRHEQNAIVWSDADAVPQLILLR